jgi:hypothetical protein
VCPQLRSAHVPRSLSRKAIAMLRNCVVESQVIIIITQVHYLYYNQLFARYIHKSVHTHLIEQGNFGDREREEIVRHQAQQNTAVRTDLHPTRKPSHINPLSSQTVTYIAKHFNTYHTPMHIVGDSQNITSPNSKRTKKKRPMTKNH